MTLVICVVSRGRPNGKTCLIEALTEKFVGEEFRVARVKCIHIDFETAKRDTWLHLKTGVTFTAAITPTEIITIRKSKAPSLDEALGAIYFETDLVLVEGYEKSPYPKILYTHTALDALAAMKNISNIVMISGSIASKAKEKEMFTEKFPDIRVYDLEEMVSAIKEMLVKEVLQSLPGLNCGHCGHDTCLGLAEAILSREANREDCEVLSTNLATLEVDGIVIPLGKFPQQILRGVTMGVLNNLKGVDKHLKKIKVTIKTE